MADETLHFIYSHARRRLRHAPTSRTPRWQFTGSIDVVCATGSCTTQGLDGLLVSQALRVARNVCVPAPQAAQCRKLRNAIAEQATIVSPLRQSRLWPGCSRRERHPASEKHARDHVEFPCLQSTLMSHEMGVGNGHSDYHQAVAHKRGQNVLHRLPKTHISTGRIPSCRVDEEERVAHPLAKAISSRPVRRSWRTTLSSLIRSAASCCRFGHTSAEQIFRPALRRWIDPLRAIDTYPRTKAPRQTNMSCK